MIEASVIIPTYNRAEKLRRCLRALSEQTQPASDFEVIVVNDGSQDSTLEMLAGLKTRFTLQVVSQSNSGEASARNHGAAESQGRISIFLDDDIIVNPQFIEQHLSLHRRRDRVVGIGQLTLTLTSGADWFARGFARGWQYHYDQFNHGTRQPDWGDCYAGNMSVARAIFIDVGGNATDLKRGCDVELAYRLKQYGCAFEYLPDAIGNQYESKGFCELSADAEQAGVASVELVHRFPDTEAELLGHFQKYRRSWILLWHILLVSDLSSQAMERLHKLAGKRGESFGWYAFFSHYYFWRGVRRVAPERTTLKQMFFLR